MHVQMGAIISDMRLWLYARTTCTYERKSVLGGGGGGGGGGGIEVQSTLTIY